MDILLKGGTLIDAAGRRRADILVRDGRIAAIGPDLVFASGAEVIDCSGRLVSEGFTDIHVHFREPGQGYKETIRTGSLAAAHGGYTTVCAMPNLNPVPDSPETLALEQEIIDRDACIRVLPYAAITRGRRGEQLVDFAALKDRCCAFSDDGSGVQREEMMRSAMQAAAREDVIIAAHCEDNTLLHGGYIHDGRYAAAHGHKGICSESEWGQIARDLRLAEETGCRYHVCHISCAESVELIRAAKARGVRVTCETGPHYLSLCEDDLQEDGRFKMNPPLRRAEDRQALIEGLLDGTIDAIATDHAPHSAEEKSRGLAGSAMGIVGLETAFPVLYTDLVLPGIVSLERVIEALTSGPRTAFRLGSPAAGLQPGAPADLTVIDPDAAWTVDPADFRSMGKATPFAGKPVRSRIVLTLKDGVPVWQSIQS
ncbi:MAG: dihydroorotase [Bacteroidales bacterium]|nr:dihydroorotase [Bacteroidales bacterium]